MTAYSSSRLFEAWDEQLTRHAQKNPDICTVDAEAKFMVKSFRESNPRRAIQVGIAEQDMIGVAAGMAARGKIVFAHTMATFLTLRACEMIRDDIACNRFNVKLVGSYAGVLGGPFGPTHQGLEDIAVMRVIPQMTVVVPADTTEVKQVARAAVDFDGPMYIRLEAEMPVYDKEHHFEVGQSIVLREGEDMTLMAYGAMVGRSLKAAGILHDRGVETRVVNMHTVKPLDKQAILDAASETKAILTVEEHSIIGGLGSAVAEFIAEEVPHIRLKRIGFEDTFSVIGQYEQLLRHYGLDAQGIADKALAFQNSVLR